jgi:hypothetical protein
MPMPVMTIKPTTQRSKDECAIEVTAQVAGVVTHRVAAVLSTLADAMASTDKTAQEPRAWVRRELAALYASVLEEIDRELDGDDAKWRALLAKSRPSKCNRSHWAECMGRSDDGGRLNTGAIDAYLAGDFDDEQVQS